MRALTLIADRKIELTERPVPPPPAPGEVQIRVRAVALNHIDVWGWRGIAFAKRRLPLGVGRGTGGRVPCRRAVRRPLQARRYGRDVRGAHLRRLPRLSRGPRQS